MPRKASSVMEERLRFVGRLLDGESMSDVCREFGISRKTGYKIYSRYREHGLFALTDRTWPGGATERSCSPSRNCTPEPSFSK
jgi:transposase